MILWLKNEHSHKNYYRPKGCDEIEKGWELHMPSVLVSCACRSFKILYESENAEVEP